MTETARRRPLWAVYEILAMVFGLGSLALICLAWLPFALVLKPVLPRRLGQPFGRSMISGGFRCYLWLLERFCCCRFDLSELDRLRDAGPLVVAANHPSLLDAVIIVSRLPGAVCVMKAALLDNILFGAAARLARYIRNNEPLEMILHAREELQSGAQLLIFPEGTRTLEFPVGPCSPSAGMIARRSQCPVQTVLIEFSSPYLGKAWPLFQRPRLPLRCRARLGQRFSPPDDVPGFTRQLEAYFLSEVKMGWSEPSTVAEPSP